MPFACQIASVTEWERGSNAALRRADITNIFKDLAHDRKKCVIVVTHSKELAEEADEVILLKGGKIDLRELPR